MTREELATQLNGREYDKELTPEEEKDSKEAGLVVIFGASDDLLELRGAFDEEVGAFGGTEIKLTPKGVLGNECDDEDCPYFQALWDATKAWVRARWDEHGFSWWLDSNIPYSPFHILEDGVQYCRGIVINIKDISEVEE